MRKTFKYRIDGNGQTLNNAENWLGLCRNLYNAALEEKIIAYKERGINISTYSQSNELPELKRAFPEYNSVGSQVLQDVIERLARTYESFFRRVHQRDDKVGFPRFKGKGHYDSFTLKQCGWKLNGKYLTIHNLGRFKLRLSRPIEGVIKTIIIRKTPTNKWYACFNCDAVFEKKLPESNKSIGIDVGIKSFCVDSNETKTDNPKYFDHSQVELKRKDRRLSRRVKYSNRRTKARILVAKVHEKISNQRNDFLHKLANKYISDYGIIYIEDLSTEGMARNHNLSKSINDASWGKFFELLSYKAEEAGRKVVKVPRFEPTSKTCSQCGAINQELKLSDRQWVCKSCGVLHDRDYNAAKNILRVGQTLQESTYENTQCVSCESSLVGECQLNGEKFRTLSQIKLNR